MQKAAHNIGAEGSHAQLKDDSLAEVTLEIALKRAPPETGRQKASARSVHIRWPSSRHTRVWVPFARNLCIPIGQTSIVTTYLGVRRNRLLLRLIFSSVRTIEKILAPA
jgi:hypothetical protein